MKSLPILILLAVNVVLGLVLGQQWVDRHLQPRPFMWHEPAVKKLPPELLAVNPVAFHKVDVAQLTATIERPLFFSTRRPPDPPPPPPKPVEPPPPPPPDPLANFELYGVFAVGDKGGVVARVDGKMQQFHFGDMIGPWKLQSAKGRTVTFVNEAKETRELTMSYRAQLATAPAASAPAGSPPPATTTRANDRSYMAPGTPAYDQAIVAYRARINAARAKSGLPPIEKW